MHLVKQIKVFYAPTDGHLNCLKNNFKFYIKIDIKTSVCGDVAISPHTNVF
jgi:hypothetical protein